MAPMRLSLAWPLTLVYAVLIVYASLYPFEGWRSQGVTPWAYLRAPWPQYWTAFDAWTNLVGYLPLGLLLALAVARSGWPRAAWVVGVLGPALLSLLMEAVQGYLPARVPSQTDVLLNALGGALGAVLGLWLLRWRVLGPWNQFRRDWVVGRTHGGLVVLVLWPFAALYPAPVPFGLGQVWLRVEAALSDLLQGTPFLVWLPLQAEPAALSPVTQLMAVALCVWAPVLLGYALLRTVAQRVVFVLLWAGLIAVVGQLSSALTFGPAHAWVWLTPPVWLGLAAAAGLSVLSLGLSHRACAVLMLLALTYALGLLNRAPEIPYFAQALAVWEQGRFIHFHGLSQWLGWLWPYLALVVGMRLALQRPGGLYNAGP